MDLRHELRIFAAVVQGCNLLLAFAAATLFTRMESVLGELSGLTAGRLATQPTMHKLLQLQQMGAWLAVALGVMGLWIGLAVHARWRQRLLHPLEEINGVLASAQNGRTLRRCGPRVTSTTLVRIAEHVNQLLDVCLAAHRPVARDDLARLQRSLIGMLEREAGPAALVEASGQILAANRSMLQLLSGERGDRVRLALAAPQTASAPGSRQPLTSDTFLVRFPDEG